MFFEINKFGYIRQEHKKNNSMLYSCQTKEENNCR